MSETPTVGHRRITLDILAQLVGRTFNIGLGVVATVALVRGLGVHDYGEWSTLFAVSGLVDSAGTQAMDRVAVPRAAENPEREPQWLGALLRSRAMFAVPSTLIALAIVLAISRDAHMRLTGIVIALMMPAAVLATLGIVFKLRVRNDVNVLVTTLNSLLWTGAVLALAGAGAGMLPYAIAFAAILFLTSGVQAALGFRRGSIDVAGGRELTRRLIKLSIPIGLFGLAVTAYNRVDQLIVFELAGTKDAGLYGAAYRILDQGGFVPGTFAVTITPILAAAYRTDLERVRRLLQAAADNLMLIALGCFAFAVAAGKPFLEALYGREYGQAAHAFAILMGAYVVICLATVLGTMVVTLNLQRKLVPYAVITLVVNVGLNLIFVPPFGYVAAAWVTVVTELLILVLTIRLLQPIIELKPKVERFLRTCATAAVAGLAVWAMRRAGVPLAGLMAGMVAIYVPLLFALRAVSMGEVRMLLASRAAA